MRAHEFITEGEIGPHEGKEFELMMSGQKPVALISAPEKMPDFLEQVKLGNFIMTASAYELRKQPGVIATDRIYFFARPESRLRMEELAAIFNKNAQSGSFTDDDHRRIGQLLGYSEDDIEVFFTNLKKFK